MKRFLPIFAFIAISLFLLSACAKSGGPALSGNYGPNLHWSYNPDKRMLVISGTGEMPDYTTYEIYPWKYYEDDVTSIILEEGITSIGREAFQGTQITSIVIPNTVVRIGGYAFIACENLKMITIGKNVKVIEQAAFAPSADGYSLFTPITVFNYATTPQVINAGVFTNSWDYYKDKDPSTWKIRNLAESVLYVPRASLNAYKTAEVWKMFGHIEPLD